ncbi:hypothetical protein AFA2_03562 [Alcaligenes faecalis subsp. faecalis NBRC 13111]|nr:hypothetical protein AFA2_03562 [Alcaligenes faecalis subsp. faecalis NBRC 13111]CAJ0908084.1 protein of unknown function [Alcaligenes faecalis subsp. faecalis]
MSKSQAYLRLFLTIVDACLWLAATFFRKCISQTYFVLTHMWPPLTLNQYLHLKHSVNKKLRNSFYCNTSYLNRRLRGSRFACG